ncbi:MAG: dihydropteroate synthase [Candidatus Nanopelagicales bacterium]|nr:dihydropteroate synthase [Candidatus Nanopelagicales bacterium]
MPTAGPLILGRRRFEVDDRIIMAIVNRTTDSFFKGGSTFEDADAMAAVVAAVESGAQVIDIGGVKAGPGTEVDPQEEISRTASFVAQVRARFPEIVISVDTWRAEVGRAVCQEGADLLNDAWGGVDPALAEVAAEFGVGIVCTHAGGQQPRTRPHRVQYDDVMASILDSTCALAERAVSLGVAPERVIIDPGHDFGKNTAHSLEATRRLASMVETGWPVLVSLSRKDFVGESLGLADPHDRLVGTLATTAISSHLGARMYRVHDVAPTLQTLEMERTIAGVRRPTFARRGLA